MRACEWDDARERENNDCLYATLNSSKKVLPITVWKAMFHIDRENETGFHD